MIHSLPIIHHPSFHMFQCGAKRKKKKKWAQQVEIFKICWLGFLSKSAEGDLNTAELSMEPHLHKSIPTEM